MRTENDTPASAAIERKLDEVRGRILSAMAHTPLAESDVDLARALGGGKMLRARLVLRLAPSCGAADEQALRAATAVEMVHGASLLHDDVIDGGRLRRAEPAFWVRHGVQAAILVGDLLLCEAARLLRGADSGRLMHELIACTAEVCRAEVEQELILRGRASDWATAVRLARQKTGALFAFSAVAACGDIAEERFRQALREAGYRAGTAYQLSDDLLDLSPEADWAGKTLGRDRARHKVTAGSVRPPVPSELREMIETLRTETEGLLSPYDGPSAAWSDYWSRELGPVLERNLAVRPDLAPIPA